jgi:hypothetical protein
MLLGLLDMGSTISVQAYRATANKDFRQGSIILRWGTCLKCLEAEKDSERRSAIVRGDQWKRTRCSLTRASSPQCRPGERGEN